MNKPITVLRQEFIDNLQSLIENAGLMPFMVHDVLMDFDRQIQVMAKRQYDEDLARYEQSLGAVKPEEIEYKEIG